MRRLGDEPGPSDCPARLLEANPRSRDIDPRALRVAARLLETILGVSETIPRGPEVLLPLGGGAGASGITAIAKVSRHCLEMANPLTRPNVILVVEDHDVVREIVARVLRQGGYVVIEARDGQQAIDILAGDLRIDMVVVDLVMPHLGGLQLAMYLDTLPEPRPSLLFMSGYDQGKAKLPGPFLKKPFAPETLVAEVHRVMVSRAHRYTPAGP